MTRFMQCIAVAVALTAQLGNACQPLSQDRYDATEKRVRARFDSVDSVELATLQRADVVKVKEGGIDFEMEAERAVFRVDRVYKGKSRPGDTLVFISSSACAFSVVGNPRFKTIYDVSRRKPVVPAKQWLIYRRTGQKTEITDSDLTRPITQAFTDVAILERIASPRR